MRKIPSLTVLLVAASVLPAAAVTDTVIFNATVLSTCVITIGGAGTMAANSDFTVLGSQETGGVAGTATLLTTGADFEVSTAAPGSFTTAPAGGGDNVSFASSYDVSRPLLGDLLGVNGPVATLLGVGLNNLSVDLTATKSSGHFPTGAYVAEVIVTCEQAIP